MHERQNGYGNVVRTGNGHQLVANYKCDKYAEWMGAMENILTFKKMCLITVQIYLQNSTICVLWPQDGEFQLDTSFQGFPYSLINIDATNLNDKLKENEVQNIKEKFMEDNPLTLMLTLAIEKSHCEVFF